MSDDQEWKSQAEIWIEWEFQGQRLPGIRVRADKFLAGETRVPDAIAKAPFKRRMYDCFSDEWTKETLLTKCCPIRFLGQLQGESFEDRSCSERAHSSDAIFVEDPEQWVKANNGRWSQESFWWEWEHVTDASQKPVRTMTSYNRLTKALQILQKDSNAKCQPFWRCHVLSRQSQHWCFHPEFMQATAETYCKVHALDHCEFLGVLYNGETAEFHKDVPHGEMGSLHSPVYWMLPQGTVRCWSLSKLLRSSAAELREEHDANAYRRIARARGLHAVGACSMEEFSALVETRVGDKAWEHIDFKLPAHENAPCAWIVNPSGPHDDKVKMFTKTLFRMELEMLELRVATPAKLHSLLRERRASNKATLEALCVNPRWPAQGFENLGTDVGDITKTQIHELQVWADSLRTSDVLDVAAAEDEQLEWHAARQVQQAVARLCTTQTEEIFAESFPDTPRGCYQEISDRLQATQERAARTFRKRSIRLSQLAQERMEASKEQQSHEKDPQQDLCDPDSYGFSGTILPKGHVIATEHAEIVLEDRMRVALELHYDQVFRTTWLAKHANDDGESMVPQRPRRNRIQPRVLECVRQERYEVLSLPEELRDILQRPAQEKDPSVLEQVADVLRVRCSRVRRVELYARKEVEALIADLSASGSTRIKKAHQSLTCGAEILDVIADANLESEPSVHSQRNFAKELHIAAVSLPVLVVIREVVADKSCAYPLGKFGMKVLHEKKPILKLAREFFDIPPQPEDVLDMLLVELGMVQWCDMIRRWHAAEKCWTTKKQIIAAGHAYVNGQSIGHTPIYDSMCAWCGNMLYGAINSSELGNKFSGNPVDVNGAVLKCTRAQGLQRQPPFLQRWAPAFFAECAPDVFEWDSTARRLSLRSQHRDRPPWVRLEHNRVKDPNESWLYCESCHHALFEGPDDTQPRIPFRDQRSTAAMQRVPEMPPSTGAAENFSEDVDWERDLAEHARTSSGSYSFRNLVPRAEPTLWQHAPHIPFDKLQSQTAVSRLSLCTLDNCLKESRIEDGRPVYASQRGDTNFWRRNPQQISGTLAFMLARDEGREFQLRAEEVPHVRTCLRWLRTKNPHFKIFWANVERFGMLYDALKAVVPQGDLRTPVRVARNKPVESAVASVVGDTMQSEDAVLVVLDPGEFPASWAVVNHLADSVGSMSLRAGDAENERDLPLDTDMSTNVQQAADALRT